MNFEDGLSECQSLELEKLVTQAERNRIEAQQFSIEASKLLAITRRRLNDYMDRGFFKRCWYAVSGKQGELDRANQGDLIQMQRFAWAYLSKLQEQNILEANAIAVIRSNLKEVQSEVSEINDMISMVVDKFDARIKKLEESSAILDWRNHIEANASKFDREHRQICFLELVFDCLKTIRENSIKFGGVRIEEYFYTSMKQLGLNPEAEYTVEEFVSRLYADVCAVGFSKFRQIVALEVCGANVPSAEILKYVSGAGYNAIYQFDMEMEKMQSMSQQLEPEIAKEAMLRTVQQSIDNGSARYCAKELAMEIIGASLMIEEVVCQQRRIRETGFGAAGGNWMDGDDARHVDEMLEDSVDIVHHVFIDDEPQPSEDEKYVYLESFAVLLAKICEMRGVYKSHYLTALAKLFGKPDALCRIESLLQSPARIKGLLPELKNVLNTKERKYAWCVDALGIAFENGEITKEVRDFVLKMSEVLMLMRNESMQLLAATENLLKEIDRPNPINEDALREIVYGAKGLDVQTKAWRSLAEFRRIEVNNIKRTCGFVVNYGSGLDRMRQLAARYIVQHSSFSVVDVPFGKQGVVVKCVEQEIEKSGFTCRVRTANRAWVVAGVSVMTFGTAALAAAAIVAHNALTANPDFEIVKDMVGSNVRIRCLI